MNYRQEIASTPELAAWYDQKYTEMGDGWVTPPEECNRHLDDLGVPLDKTKSLLDVGCGAGHFLAEAAKRVQGWGCEISRVGAELSRRRARNAMVLHGSIEDMTKFAEFAGEGFDYIVSLGSLEHIVDLDRALDHIRDLLNRNGKFYFYCPNEGWKHFDQPNERTMTDIEWMALFERHGLFVDWAKRWGDNTAFCGSTRATLRLNIGSGQRRFDTLQGWVNIDRVSRPGREPDLICDVGATPLPYTGDSIDCCVMHHILEHFGCGEGNSVIAECYRVLKPGCSLIVTVPDLRALAQRWLIHAMNEQLYKTNVYGAYEGEESDRHKWGYTGQSLIQTLTEAAPWARVRPFNWRAIPGADIARDWWILGMEAVK